MFPVHTYVCILAQAWARLQPSLYVAKIYACSLKCIFFMIPPKKHPETKPKPSKSNPPYRTHIFISYTFIYDEMQKRHPKRKSTNPSKTNPSQPPIQPPKPPYVTHTVYSRTRIKASTLINIILNKRVDAPKRVFKFSIVGGGALTCSAVQQCAMQQSGAQRS